MPGIEEARFYRLDRSDENQVGRCHFLANRVREQTFARQCGNRHKRPEHEQRPPQESMLTLRVEVLMAPQQVSPVVVTRRWVRPLDVEPGHWKKQLPAKYLRVA